MFWLTSLTFQLIIMQCIYMFWRQLVCRARETFIQKQHSGNYCAPTPNQETLFLLKWKTKQKAHICDSHIINGGECCFELRGHQMKDQWLLELIMSLSCLSWTECGPEVVKNNWPVDETQNHMLITIYIYVNEKEHILKIKIIVFILLPISNLQLHLNYQSLEYH